MCITKAIGWGSSSSSSGILVGAVVIDAMVILPKTCTTVTTTVPWGRNLKRRILLNGRIWAERSIDVVMMKWRWIRYVPDGIEIVRLKVHGCIGGHIPRDNASTSNIDTSFDSVTSVWVVGVNAVVLSIAFLTAGVYCSCAYTALPMLLPAEASSVINLARHGIHLKRER